MIKVSIIIGFLCLLFVSISDLKAQKTSINISGNIKDKTSQDGLSFANIVLKKISDASFVTGTVANENGLFTLSGVNSGDYEIEVSSIGYTTYKQELFVGSASQYLNIGIIFLSENTTTLNDVVITGEVDAISAKMDKKTFELKDNISQGGGSVLQSMQNLPGVTIEDGKVLLRGNDKVTILIDGKQTALTGFGSQTGLNNLPASAIEKIEIINNPSSKYDANGNAGIINIIFKKEKKEGFNGNIGLTTGAGALWVRKENLPTIRPQYTITPKINPSLALNYRKNKVNAFFQADNLYTQTLNKNEFVTRTYDDGTVIQQQTKRNRNTNFLTTKAGLDYTINDHNSFTFSGLFGSEKIIDHGDEPFFNGDQSERLRLWQFLEDELKTTVMATSALRHQFLDPGHTLNVGLNYTFHRENEQYFFDNILLDGSSKDAFKLLSDEHVADLTMDYVRPLKYGKVEAGMKVRKRIIPTNMQFFPGVNSPLDTGAGGAATYNETIPAVYGNYLVENKKIDAELGVRVEYVDLKYQVNPNHNTYKSDGYQYIQPFPNARVTYKINDSNRLTAFFNRRVDRPNEVDIRIFPKYDDAEIIKVGNPGLKPQFTNALELGYKTIWKTGSLYGAAYHRMVDGTITRLSVTAPGSTLIYAIFQNVNKSYNSGFEIVLSQDMASWVSFNMNVTAYHNQIDAFTVINKYPVEQSFSADKQEIVSGNAKLNVVFHLAGHLDAQLTGIYLAPDIIPQGKIASRYSLDVGVKKQVQNGKGELFANATDLLNTLVIRKTINGNNFSYVSADYYETQTVRIGYNYKF